MNLKKITIIALLVVVQAAAVLPSASAASVTSSDKTAAAAQTQTAAETTKSQTANTATPGTTTEVKSVQGEQAPQDETEVPAEGQPADANAPTDTQQPPVDEQPADGEMQTDGSTDPVIETPPSTPVQNPNQTPTKNPTTNTPAANPSATPAIDFAAATEGNDKLILVINGDKMYQKGQTYTAAQPMTAKNGVSYIAVRSFVDRVGLKLTYDAKTKETVISKGSDELRFKLGTDTYTVNGVPTKMKGASFQQKNTFMVPLTSITQALGIPYTIDYKAKTITLTISSKPVASFTVEPKKIIAGETMVTYNTKSESPSGYEIVDERWEGRQDVFTDPGVYTVSYSVQDSKGQWSDPYTQTITVEAPNVPPVAQFTTDKETYRMGEPITYTDQSYDPDGVLPEANSRVWENQKGAYFTPGPQTITLTVTDADGAKATVSKTITITDEMLYTQDEYNQLFVPVGSKFLFDGGSVPPMHKIEHLDTMEDVTLYRSNSPESVYNTGKLYEDTLSGKVRFMIHHANYTKQKVTMYVVATNNNATPTTIETLDSGFGGPSPFAMAAGKVSVQRYHQAVMDGSKKSTVTLQPGESKIILTELNAIPMANETVISLIADVNSSQPITYSTLMIDPSLDPIQEAKNLPVVARDGVHNRGTYPLATKIFQVFEPIGGSTPSKLVLGDNSSDPNLTGTDAPFNTVESNAGNFGVLYKIHLESVAPNTLITFNGRGGKYLGWIVVNGQLVELSAQSMGLVGAGLNTSSEAGVIYRTGNTSESVDLEFTPAPGSNLSVNLLFTQMPARKQ
ncbi:DNA-directed RNA polymerase subunit beta [Saccharibacillus sp. O23]|uniref:stalk domain-containing protein n=1 Tax=Saccharibacillus sp. O23 TaxID=2009338 RepID=UPI000B4E68DB|nr:stalk domain-containing protein [Saccharibacillus sp. O23]OWR28758.1 DNA-directed RNA polymerase subunit beta [Saccharibacillus sp. O23]